MAYKAGEDKSSQLRQTHLRRILSELCQRERKACRRYVTCFYGCSRSSKSHSQMAARCTAWVLWDVQERRLLPTIQLKSILRGKIGICACGLGMRYGDGRTIATYCTCSTIFVEQSLTRIALLYSPATMYSASNAQCRRPLSGQIRSR